MLGLKKKVQQIQKKPYETKVKILWVSVSVAFILILALWIVTINLRNGESDQGQPVFTDLKENIEQLKQSNPFSK